MKTLFKVIVILLFAVIAFQAMQTEAVYSFLLSPVVHIVALLLALNIITLRGKMDATQILAKLLIQQELMVQKLYDIEQALHPMVRANVIEIYTTKNGVRVKVDHMLVKVGEAYILECLPKYDDGAGNLVPAKIDGAPAWSVSDESLAKLELIDGEPFKAKVTMLAEGSVVAQAACDVDRGEAVKTLVGEASFEIAGPEATVIALSISKE